MSANSSNSFFEYTHPVGFEGLDINIALVFEFIFDIIFSFCAK